MPQRDSTPPPKPQKRETEQKDAEKLIAKAPHVVKPVEGSGRRKEWRPDDPIDFAPLFQPSAWGLSSLAKYFFGWPGYLWPWNCIYLAICVLSYHYATSSVGRCVSLTYECVLPLFAKNEVLIWMVVGGWHFLLYQVRIYGLERKYDTGWPEVNNRKFLFGDQVYDNVFWSCVSGVGIWTLYEACFMRLWAHSLSPVYFDWWSRPCYSFAWLLAIPIWREFHFYWIHRMIHWKPLYSWTHYLHHKNVNPGPWSGLAMHPVEHLLYFSVVLIHAFIPSHPIHFFFNAQHTALTPASGHTGFHLSDKSFPSGSYFHYLHHRYFECNYGEATIPLDRWFGTFRDGKSVGADLAVTGGDLKATLGSTSVAVVVGSLVSLVPLAYTFTLLN